METKKSLEVLMIVFWTIVGIVATIMGVSMIYYFIDSSAGSTSILILGLLLSGSGIYTIIYDIGRLWKIVF